MAGNAGPLHRQPRIFTATGAALQLIATDRQFLQTGQGKIEPWTDDGQTAVCPLCQVDSVLDSASGVALEPSFLQRMHDYWFD